jgi:DNA-binding transcriptional ArsR family regulator
MLQNHSFHLGVDRMRVELDKKSLFALASDTRLEILRSLQPMRRSISQLSEALNIDKAAVHRHLKKMEEGGLVKRYEDHGFVYYGLSWKARDLMSPNENTKVVILLSCSWLFILGVTFLLVAGIASHSSDTGLFPGKGHPWDHYGTNNTANERIAFLDNEPMIVWILPAAILAASACALTFTALRKMRRPKQLTIPSDGEQKDLHRPIPED